MFARQEVLMGRRHRSKPARLAEKLLHIRTVLGLSQEAMAARLDIADAPGRHYISGFELGTREPTLATLLRYAELVNVWIDVLARDDLDIPPPPWPYRGKSGGVKRAPASPDKRSVKKAKPS
jgi:transcriptional regulator with XRE-family HTH domain